MKIKLLLPFLLLITNLFFASESPRGIISISIQKAGTHLLKKCIRKLIENKFFYILFRDQNEQFMSDINDKIDLCTILSSPIMNYINNLDTLPKTYLNGNENNKPIIEGCIAHLIYSKKSAKILENRLLANFLIIRDPRDQIVSYAYWKKEQPRYGHLYSDSLHAIMLDQITTGNTNINPFRCNIIDYYNLFLPWLNLENFCLELIRKLLLA